ncbi:FUSC family protein [Acetobacter sp. DsW_059]|uniref:FUSC family protein n=1 Tax=Acetobacter sp. DsW_059 TaxID=1670661 RepID=UPI000A365CAF|nr:FUSC family protein [Acetobacter sp. DsW_059]OUJ12099.1 hypothetical protein HK25_04755 [Acetobacter sp. DsW_059]
MSPSGAHGQLLPPQIDEGDPPQKIRLLLAEMAPTPGRLRNTLLLLVQAMLTIIIGETFRVPELPILVVISFFLSGNDAASNASTALMGGLTMIVGTGLTIVLLMMSLSEPAIRLPCMLLLTLGAGFLSQAATMGPFLNILLFWIVYMAMNADLLQSAGSLVDGYVGNTTDSVVPDSIFMPPEEAILHLLLWIGVLFLIALFLLVFINKIAGHDPLVALRSGLAGRLSAIVSACSDDPVQKKQGLSAVNRFAAEGVAGLRQAHDLTARLHPELPRHRTGIAIIRTMARLVMIFVEWSRLYSGHNKDFTRDISCLAGLCADVLRNRKVFLPALESETTDLIAQAEVFRDDSLYYPLALEMARCLTLIRALLLKPDVSAHEFAPDVKAAARAYFKPDAFTNPAYTQAAMRIALSVSVCYAITRFTSWPGIQTCVVTCFLVSLETLGDSVHKMILRVIGALIGAASGIMTILVFMPYMTDCTDLLLAIIPVTFLAGWVKSGSPRISYAGVQIALAYFMTLLHGYGPTLDMEAGRDRVVGILIGNVVVYIIATLFWPVSVTDRARRHLVSAIRGLGDLVICRRSNPEKLVDIAQEIEREKFGKALAAVRSSMANAPMELSGIRNTDGVCQIDTRIITHIQMLAVPVAILADIYVPVSDDAFGHMEKLKNWFDTFAQWVSDGQGTEQLYSQLPKPPYLPDDPQREAWFFVLNQRVQYILHNLLPASDCISEGSKPFLNTSEISL